VPALSLAMMFPVLLLFSVIRSITCSECDMELARETYACCIKPGDVHSKGLTNCTFFYRQGQCKAGEQLTLSAPPEGSCDPYPLSVENSKGILCKGVKKPDVDNGGVALTQSIALGGNKEDPSTYDNITYLWSCSKPPPPSKQATVLLDPPSGNISAQSDMIYLNVTLESGFPQAFSSIHLPSGEFNNCINSHTITGETGLVTDICKYRIYLWARETNFTVQVYQEGFTNKTFHYKATTTVFPSEDQQDGATTVFPIGGQQYASRCQRIMGNQYCLVFLIFCFNYIFE